MDSNLLRSIWPYLVGLALSAALFIYAGYFTYQARPGQLGPETWPRLAVALMAAACLYEIGRRILVGNKDATGLIEELDRTEDTEEAAPSYMGLLLAGILLISLYAVALAYVGFIVATFFFLAAFMYLGRYRNHAVIWGVSALVTILCGVLFLRIAYVSLPRGVDPFGVFADVFFKIPGF